MTTPVYDFVSDYVKQNPLRLHMPGHKGTGPLGCEPWDLTEIPGADALYQDRGILRESQENAAALFGSGATLYSAQGSSLCVRAMLFLALTWANRRGKSPRIAAGRNAHSSFLSGVALLDLPVDWLWGDGLLTYTPDLTELESLLSGPQPPAAVYLTCPDYLGNLPHLAPVAALCHRYGALLLVDNAHGAYLKFLDPSRHPLDQGADLCCDSAHKTLPVLTGGAYLHISREAPVELAENARRAMALFASTSPSYLILQSLDLCNRYLQEGYPQKLAAFLEKMLPVREKLVRLGWTLLGDEPLKLTLSPKGRGYTGEELARLLAQKGLVAEFADPDYLVLMLSPEWGGEEPDRLLDPLTALPVRPPIPHTPPRLTRPRRVLTPRQALLSPQEEIPVEQALGRVLGSPQVSCPPAVPILVCGEAFDPSALAAFAYYGRETCLVVQKNHF